MCLLFMPIAKLQIWDIETGQVTASNYWHSRGWGAQVIGWNNTADYFMTTSLGFGSQHTYNTESVRIWDAETREPINALTETG